MINNKYKVAVIFLMIAAIVIRIQFYIFDIEKHNTSYDKISKLQTRVIASCIENEFISVKESLEILAGKIKYNDDEKMLDKRMHKYFSFLDEVKSIYYINNRGKIIAEYKDYKYSIDDIENETWYTPVQENQETIVGVRNDKNDVFSLVTPAYTIDGQKNGILGVDIELELITDRIKKFEKNQKVKIKIVNFRNEVIYESNNITGKEQILTEYSCLNSELKIQIFRNSNKYTIAINAIIYSIIIMIIVIFLLFVILTRENVHKYCVVLVCILFLFQIVEITHNVFYNQKDDITYIIYNNYVTTLKELKTNRVNLFLKIINTFNFEKGINRENAFKEIINICGTNDNIINFITCSLDGELKRIPDNHITKYDELMKELLQKFKKLKASGKSDSVDIEDRIRKCDDYYIMVDFSSSEDELTGIIYRHLDRYKIMQNMLYDYDDMIDSARIGDDYGLYITSLGKETKVMQIKDSHVINDIKNNTPGYFITKIDGKKYIVIYGEALQESEYGALVYIISESDNIVMIIFCIVMNIVAIIINLVVYHIYKRTHYDFDAGDEICEDIDTIKKNEKE